MNNPLVQPDPGLFIWTIVTFLVLLALLAKFAWKPLLAALDSRQESIRKALDDARKAKQELEGIHTESAKLLAEARREAAARKAAPSPASAPQAAPQPRPGPTPAERLAQLMADERAETQERKKKMRRYGLVVSGAILAGFILWLLSAIRLRR